MTLFLPGLKIHFTMSELSGQQILTIAIVYATSILPLIVLIVLYALGKLPRWVAAVYLFSFLVCAVGLEIWFTFGLWGGAPVSERRPPVMNLAIPQYANWALTSLADAAAICLVGLFLIWLAYGRRPIPFRKWRWGAFVVLLVWFVLQNIWVEMFISPQVAPGYKVSWAPPTPAGPWWNPTLFSVNGLAIHLQVQMPWVLMTPIFYFIVLACYRRLSGDVPDEKGKYRD
ncbi:MAG: hypothetical protein NT177_08065 [Chloroflexi bacterium]|nr:hypothetical protein [Chloroflexota bacterium]